MSGIILEINNMNSLLAFYKNKKVFLTGHTGFKGTWLSRILILAGAEVTGYSLEPPTEPSLFEQTNTAGQMNSMSTIFQTVRMYRRQRDAGSSLYRSVTVTDMK